MHERKTRARPVMSRQISNKPKSAGDGTFAGPIGQTAQFVGKQQLSITILFYDLALRPVSRRRSGPAPTR